MARTEFQPIATGYGFTEGPVWDFESSALFFNDIPGDARYRWTEASGTSRIASPTGKSNGMVFDADGRLLVCEHTTSAVTRVDAEGNRSILADRFRGQELNSPNDLVWGPDGLVYFTDPPYGRLDDVDGVKRDQELDFQGIFRFDPEAGDEIELVDDSLHRPNGLCFSIDGTVLYVNDTERWTVHRYRRSEDGRYRGPELLLEMENDGDLDGGVPDGMKLDSLGRIWVSGPGGIWVVSDSGEVLEVIETPEVVGNFTWGGADLRELFVCAGTSVYRLAVETPGWAGFPAPGRSGANR